MRKLIATVALTVLSFSGSGWADVIESRKARESITVGSGERLAIHNLAGTVTIEGSRGKAVEIEATFYGGGDDREAALAMVNKLGFDVVESGGRTRVWVTYPTDEFRYFSYRPEDRWGRSNSQVRYRGDRVTVSNSSRGAVLYADLTVKVPRGVNLFFENMVGNISADGVVGDLALDTASGSIEASGGAGRLSADTGSGSVDVENRKGDVLADTGSGSVRIEKVEGDISVDTGSGAVDVIDARSEEIEIDTGSGGVEIEDASGSLYVDTGSGSVRVKNFSAGEDLEIDTGSGGARVEGALGAVRRLRIDTGSGSVTLKSSNGLNMRLDITAGSGGIRVDLPDTKVISADDGDMEVDLGDGSGDGVIDTGSGGVRITSR